MTKREVIDKFFPELILIIEDPRDVLLFLRPWSKGLSMEECTKNVPDSQIYALYKLIKESRYKENPNPLFNEFKAQMKEATD